MQRTRRAMTIAGSDSGGGAGIQADLKTFAALGVYGSSALTAVTAQNTLGVTAVVELPPDMVAAQIDAVMSDIGADAVKTGMLANSAIIRTVAEKVREHTIENLVVDPVMVAKGGDRLLQEEAVEALRSLLVPLAAVVTPTCRRPRCWSAAAWNRSRTRAARPVKSWTWGRAALWSRAATCRAMPWTSSTTAGSSASSPPHGWRPRAPTGRAAPSHPPLTAGLAQGMDVEKAVARAKDYVTEAIRSAFPVGAGHGPLNHFHATW